MSTDQDEPSPADRPANKARQAAWFFAFWLAGILAVTALGLALSRISETWFAT
ncbi:MAG: hypothetical protein AAFZ01_03090 [Pseudomonadota bacterium]